jgi:predicted peptidase
MNTFRQFAVKVDGRGLELLLALAIIALIGQLSWPAVWDWRRRPVPGAIGIGRFDWHGALAAEYLVYLPDEGDGPWPLVVFLHGSGECGEDPNDLRDWGPFPYLKGVGSFPAIAAAPQCLPTRQWESHSVVQFVEHMSAQYDVDPERIYLVGCSMGGYGTWRAAGAYPARFAAIAPICGGGQPEDAEALADLPTWAFHGAKDEVVPVTQSKRMVEAVRAVGGAPKLTVFPDAGHGICHDVCNRIDVWAWLFRQRIGPRRTPRGDQESP